MTPSSGDAGKGALAEWTDWWARARIEVPSANGSSDAAPVVQDDPFWVHYPPAMQADGTPGHAASERIGLEKAPAIQADGGGPPCFEVLSAQSQTEEGGCVLRGEAGAGAAFNVAAAGGTGVWSFKIIRTNLQVGAFAYVGVSSESFSVAHGGPGFMFHLFDGSICSIENAHEEDFDTILLETSDALEGKTDGALIDMRVREAGGVRYVAFRVNGGSWNEVVADGLPAVVRPYARCGDGEDRIRLEKAPAIQAVVMDGTFGRGWDFITDNDTGVLRHPKSGKAVALRKGSNGWVHLQGDTGPEEIEYDSERTEPREWYDDARRMLRTLKSSPGAHPLSKWLGSTSKFGAWKFTLADGGLVLLRNSSDGESPERTRCLAAHGYERPRNAHELSEIIAKHAAMQGKTAGKSSRMEEVTSSESEVRARALRFRRVASASTALGTFAFLTAQYGSHHPLRWRTKQ